MYKDEPVSITMPAGKYFVGDPCYAVKDEMWLDWLNAADYSQNRHLVANTPDGYQVVGFNTAHGDGSYFDQYGFRYGVDAGLIGLVPYEHNPEHDSILSNVVTFDSPFVASVDEKSNMQFGHISILTDNSGEDYDDYDDEDYDEEDDDDNDDE